MTQEPTPDFIDWYSGISTEYGALRRSGMSVPDWGKVITKKAICSYRAEINRLRDQLKKLEADPGDWTDPFEEQLEELRSPAN